MAKMSAYSQDTSPTGLDYLLGVDNETGQNKRVTFEDLVDFVAPLVLASDDGWVRDVHPIPDTVTYLGNRSYQATYLTPVIDYGKEGTRKLFTRASTANTQCSDLEASSSQAWTATNATGLATGAAWTWRAWIKPESYGVMVIAAIDDGTNIMQIYLNAVGELLIAGGTAAAVDSASSYQAVVLNRWQEVTASITIGTPTAEIRIDGVVVPSVVTGSAATTMTINGDEEIYIGRNSAGNYFDGKICQVALFNAIISDTTLKTYYSQGMTGSETNCEGYWGLNGNGNDSSSNANNLTAGGGATATNVDSPFGNYLGGTLEYAMQMSLSSDGLTEVLQVAEGCAIPTSSSGIAAVGYSRVSSPQGFPGSDVRWEIRVNVKARQTVVGGAVNAFVNMNLYITVPIGQWKLGYQADCIVTHAGSQYLSFFTTLSTANNTQSDNELTCDGPLAQPSSIQSSGPVSRFKNISLSAQTIYYFNMAPNQTSSTLYIGDAGVVNATSVIYALPAYV